MRHTSSGSVHVVTNLLLGLLVAGCAPQAAEPSAAASLAVGGGLMCPADPVACDYPSRDLPYHAEAGHLEVIEPHTGRRLPIRVRAPRGAGARPVVVFEHGGGLRDGGEHESATWGNTLAAHGYVVFHLGHPPIVPAQGAALCAAAGVSVCAPDIASALARVFDLRAALEAMPTLAETLVHNGGPDADVSRLGVMGWSGGTHGAVTLAGARRALEPGHPSFSITYDGVVVRAWVLMSPSGVDHHFFFGDAYDSSWSSLGGPVLVGTGDNDVKDTSWGTLTGPLRRQPHDFAPADGQRWLLYSRLPEGEGGHGTYNLGDLDSDSMRVRRLSRALMASTRAFLDASLRAMPEGHAYLASGNAASLAGDASFEPR